MMYKAVHLHRSAQSPLHIPYTASLGDAGGTVWTRFRRHSQRARRCPTSGWRGRDRCCWTSPWLEKKPALWAAFASLSPCWCRPTLRPFRNSRCRFHVSLPFQRCKHTWSLLCRGWSCIVDNRCTIRLRLGGCIFLHRTCCRRAGRQNYAFQQDKGRNSTLR